MAAAALLISACDTSISGQRLENEPPTTQLSIRDTSLVGSIGEGDRLASTVFVSWSGSDVDGYVVEYDFRYYDEGETVGPEEGWSSTARQDTLILLPIPRGSAVANVVFEVRAVDNEGAKDPRPARTVFPIRNSPPTLSMLQADAPPDTTWPVASFGWNANDPEGEGTIDRIDIALNDTLDFVSLPAETRFITLVGRLDGAVAGSATEADVYTGRSFQNTELVASGLQLDGDNILYVRSVDQTDTTSAWQSHEWYVRRPTSNVLLVNDFRRPSATVVERFHRNLLSEYVGDRAIDVWNINIPFSTGSTVVPLRGENVPRIGDPTLRQTLALFRYIYWITSASTNSAQGNNLPFAAAVMDEFFDRGGKLMVHSPVTQPQNPEDNLGNPAILLLPLSDLVVVPDSIRRLELPSNAPVEPVNDLPGVSESLPSLKRTGGVLITELPYFASGSNVVPLYEAAYQYLGPSGRAPWTSPRTVASITADRRVGLFALPLVNENTGAPVLLGADDDPEAARRAVWMMLESLGFPR